MQSTDLGSSSAKTSSSSFIDYLSLNKFNQEANNLYTEFYSLKKNSEESNKRRENEISQEKEAETLKTSIRQKPNSLISFKDSLSQNNYSYSIFL